MTTKTALHHTHMVMIFNVNNAATELEHHEAILQLEGWRRGVRDAGGHLDPSAADMDLLERGHGRPMCAGVFLDWKPTK